MSPISSVVSSNQNTMPTKQVLTTTSADLLVQNHISPKLVDVEKIWSNSDDTVTSVSCFYFDVGRCVGKCIPGIESQRASAN